MACRGDIAALVVVCRRPPSLLPCLLLTHVKSLTSGFDGEEGFWQPAISSPSPCCSTHCPPHKQLLMGLGVGGVLFITMCGHSGSLVLSCIVPIIIGFLVPAIGCMCDPPHKQLLMSVGQSPY